MIVLSIDASFVQSTKTKKMEFFLKTIDSTIESMIINTYVYYRISLQDKKLQAVKANPEEEAHMQAL